MLLSSQNRPALSHITCSLRFFSRLWYALGTKRDRCSGKCAAHDTAHGKALGTLSCTDSVSTIRLFPAFSAAQSTSSILEPSSTSSSTGGKSTSASCTQMDGICHQQTPGTAHYCNWMINANVCERPLEQAKVAFWVDRTEHNSTVSHLCLLVLVNRQAKLDHPVDAAAKDVGVLQAEARGEQRGVKEQQDQLLDRLVALVSLCPLPELLQTTGPALSARSMDCTNVSHMTRELVCVTRI